MMAQLPLQYFQTKQQSPIFRRQIRELPLSERPLYRFQTNGVQGLSDGELLALLLGSADALDLARELLTRFGSLEKVSLASKAKLTQVKGIGKAQAGRIRAWGEMSRRLQMPAGLDSVRITTPADGANLLMPTMQYLIQEELRIICLDTRNKVQGIHTIYKGNINSNLIRIAELFRPAIEAPSAAIIVAHNHPSGDPTPSPEDVQATQEIYEAGKLLGIDVLDHVVIGRHRFVSLKERGLGFD
jgi:DNA repair protein RadC